jgi:6,7-dimethyl-8-ribityllumazine synthase
MSQRNQAHKLQPFNASKYRIGIVVAQFNADITEQLLESALGEAKKFKIPRNRIMIHRVAGSVEIPVVLKALAQTKKYDALIALGAIIRGETDHYEYVAKMVTEGILEVMIDDKPMPVGFGILTCENLTQAKARLASGAGALAAALQSAQIVRNI